MTAELPMRRRLLFALATVAVAAVGLSQGRADDVDLAKVPAKVKEAAGKAVPGAKWTAATKTVDGGMVTYELEGEDAVKGKVWVDLTADGDVNELSYLIAFGKVPQVVTAALKKRLPRFQVTASYEAMDEGKVFGYYFDGKRPRDKEEISVFVSVDGKTVEIDEG